MEDLLLRKRRGRNGTHLNKMEESNNLHWRPLKRPDWLVGMLGGQMKVSGENFQSTKRQFVIHQSFWIAYSVREG